MNEPQQFSFEGLDVRTVNDGEQVWFAAVDVAGALGIKNSRDAIAKLDDDERCRFNLHRQGDTNFISEPGLYKLIGASRKPAAKRFNRWVTHEVLPAIRKTGSYSLPTTKFQIPQTYPEALRLAADQADQIAKMQPKVDYFDKQMHNPGTMTVTVIAKGYGESAIWLNRKLKELGIIYKQGKLWVMKAKYAKKGYTNYDNWSDVDAQAVHPLLKWTQAGQKFIYDLLKSHGIVPVAEQMQFVGTQQTELLGEAQ